MSLRRARGPLLLALGLLLAVGWVVLRLALLDYEDSIDPPCGMSYWSPEAMGDRYWQLRAWQVLCFAAPSTALVGLGVWIWDLLAWLEPEERRG